MDPQIPLEWFLGISPYGLFSRYISLLETFSQEIELHLENLNVKGQVKLQRYVY